MIDRIPLNEIQITLKDAVSNYTASPEYERYNTQKRKNPDCCSGFFLFSVCMLWVMLAGQRKNREYVTGEICKFFFYCASLYDIIKNVIFWFMLSRFAVWFGNRMQGAKSAMKKTWVTVVNVLIMAAMLIFLVLYSNVESRDIRTYS